MATLTDEKALGLINELLGAIGSSQLSEEEEDALTERNVIAQYWNVLMVKKRGLCLTLFFMKISQRLMYCLTDLKKTLLSNYKYTIL